MREFSIESGHGLLLSIRDHKQNQRFGLVDIGPIDSIKSPPLKLNNLILLQCLQSCISYHVRLRLGVWIDIVFKLVILLKFLLRDEIVEFKKSS